MKQNIENTPEAKSKDGWGRKNDKDNVSLMEVKMKAKFLSTRNGGWKRKSQEVTRYSWKKEVIKMISQQKMSRVG